MIIAEKKPLDEILDMISGIEKLLILGCRGCVAVCSAGGDKEVNTLASALRLGRKKAGKPIEIDEATAPREEKGRKADRD